MRSVVLFLALAFPVLACKANAQECEQAARNFATLLYWKGAEVEIAKEPPDKRQAMRRKLLAKFTVELEGKIDMVVRQCQSANNQDQIDCMIDAKTAEQALECADLVPKE